MRHARQSPAGFSGAGRDLVVAPALGDQDAAELPAADGPPQPEEPLPPPHGGPPLPDSVEALRDDDQDQAMFAAPALVPGRHVTRCLAVTYTGTAEQVTVALSAAARGTLARDLQLEVDRGSGGRFADCAGFSSSERVFTGTLDRFAALHSGPDNALPLVATGPGGSHVFRFTVRLDEAAQSPPGARSSARFDWHLRTAG